MQRSTLWTIIGCFFLLGFLAYGQSLGNGFVRWDDSLLIYENAAIRGINFANLKTIFTTYDPELYIPLTLLSYQIDYMIAGTSAGFYHLHSLVLHVLNALLVCWLLSRLTKNTKMGLLGGALFLLHPLNTEAVAWASGRKDLLSTLWLLLSLIGYDLYREGGDRKHYIGSIAALAFGLLAKVTVLTAPVLLFLIDLLRKRRIDVKLLLPHVLLAVIFALIAYFGKTEVLGASTLSEKLLIAPASIIFYLQKIVVPYPLSVLYPVTGDISLMSLRYIYPIALLAVMIFGTLWSRRRFPVLFFGSAFFLVSLSPNLLNFFKGDALYLASDRYVYVSMIGIVLILCTRLRPIIAGGLLPILFILTIFQVQTWKSSEALFSNVIKHYPETHSAHNNLGNVKRSQGNIAEAITSYESALIYSERYGRGDQTLYWRSKILTNLASAQRVNGQLAEASKSLDDAEALTELNPHIHLQRGLLLLSQNNASGAESAYKKALEVSPEFGTAKVNLGSLYVQTGKFNDAITLLSEATEQNPFYPQAFFNLGVALRKVERNREALDAYRKAVELEPAFVAARINLGILYAERQKIKEAIEQFEEVLKYDPNNARARSALKQLGAS